MQAIGATRRRDRHPPRRPPDAGRHRPSVRQGRAGLRRDVRERAGGPAHRLPVPPRQPPPGHRGRHRRPLGAGARLVHLRRRRPDEPLQRQRLGAEDADPAPDPLRGGERRRQPSETAALLHAILDTEISPELVPADATGAIQSHRGHRRPLRAAGLQPLLHDALRLRARPRSPTSPSTPGPTPTPAPGRATSPKRRAAPTTWPEIRKWLRGVPAALLRVQPVQALGHAQRAEDQLRRLASARAATGARRPTATPPPGSPNLPRMCRRHPAWTADATAPAAHTGPAEILAPHARGAGGAGGASAILRP